MTPCLPQNEERACAKCLRPVVGRRPSARFCSPQCGRQAWLESRPDYESQRRGPRDLQGYNLKKYGLTVKTYDALLAKQSGLCAVCHGPAVGKGDQLSVDHDHMTGRVRGLLCHHCNAALGHLFDDPNLLRQAAIYLEKE
jgi:hypothetical protein